MKKLYLIWQLLFVAFSLTFTTTAWAQDVSISGVVTAVEDGAPLPGVNVMIKGTTTGASTDMDGKYSLTVAKGAALVFTYIGYVGQEVVVGDQNNIDVKLKLDIKTMSEVVVIGYGTQTKRELMGAVSQVKAKDINNIPVPSFEAALQGRAAGVQVVQSNGTPAAAVRVRVRGQASISAESEPLYVIDGVPVTNGDFSSKEYGATSANPLNPLASINPNDIESIEILKDAAAGAIYGSRAANGVVLVTTKRGSTGKTTFNFNYSVGTSTPTRKLKMLNRDEFKSLFMEAYRNDSLRDAAANPSAAPRVFPTSFGAIPINRAEMSGATSNSTNWYDEVFRVGVMQDASISASGGTDKTKFFVSGSYNKNNAMLKGNDFERFGVRVNLDNQAFKNLSFGSQTGVSFTKNRQVQTSYNGGLGLAQSASASFFPIYNLNNDDRYFGSQLPADPGVVNGINPTAQSTNQFNTDNMRLLQNLYMNWTLTENLVFRSQVGLDHFEQKERFFFSPFTRFDNYYKQKRPLGAINERTVNSNNYNFQNTLTYNKSWTDKHKLTAMLGTEQTMYDQYDMGFYPADADVGFLDPYYNTLTNNMAWIPERTNDTVYTKRDPNPGAAVIAYNSKDFYRFTSFFGRVSYNLNQKYFAQISARRDGSSRFGTNNRFGNFYAASLAWIASDEDFLKSFEALSFLKFRTSFGTTGNAGLGGNFNWLGSYSDGGSYAGISTINPNRIPNPDLSWEKAVSADAGFDFGFFNNRLTGTVNVYTKTGTDILLSRPVQVSGTGFSTLVVNSNVVVRNRGLEVSLNGVIVDNVDKRLKWETNFNIYSNNNVMLDADGIGPDGFVSGPGDSRVIEGHPVGVSFLGEFAGIDPETGAELIVNQADGTLIPLLSNTPPAVQQNNRIVSGRPFPIFAGGLNNTFTWRDFDLSFLFSFSYGNTIYDDSGKYQLGGRLSSWNQRAELLDRWTTPGQQTNVPKLTLSPFNPDQNNTTRFLHDASFIRLRTLSFGYTIPKSFTEKYSVSAARLFVTAQNLFVITKFPGWDPEVTRYADAGDQNSRNNQANIAFGAPYLPTPQARTITAGVNITF